MNLSTHFEDFGGELEIKTDEMDLWTNRLKEITKKLNKKYYDSQSDIDNLSIVGSVGRGTASHNVSDFACIYQLPKDKYKQYDEYSGNGQSALLQEIKKEIQSRYTTTKIKGDGQVVAISFKDGDIELVPAFRQSDDNFKHPDSNKGGTWKITKPFPEINEAKHMSDITNYHYINLCRLMKRWKNHVGFKFKGLLIDTMVKKFFDEKTDRKNMDYSDYFNSLKELFKFLSEQDENCSYWLALGSNQQITNSDNGKFIKKAKKAYNKLKDVPQESEQAIVKLRELLGNQFAKEAQLLKSASSNISAAMNEEFAHDKFNIDIRYNMEIDCTIAQNGFRTKKLKDFINKRLKLKARKQLLFTVEYTDIPSYLLPSINWYWKVRNVGSEAIKRNCERGQIVQGKQTLKESTHFSGICINLLTFLTAFLSFK